MFQMEFLLQMVLHVSVAFCPSVTVEGFITTCKSEKKKKKYLHDSAYYTCNIYMHFIISFSGEKSPVTERVNAVLAVHPLPR